MQDCSELPVEIKQVAYSSSTPKVKVTYVHPAGQLSHGDRETSQHNNVREREASELPT